jgi:hypothetical protein
MKIVFPYLSTLEGTSLTDLLGLLVGVYLDEETWQKSKVFFVINPIEDVILRCIELPKVNY